MKLKKYKLNIDFKSLKKSGSGAYTAIVKDEDTKDYLDINNIYGRENICLKIFYKEFLPIDDFIWGDKIKMNGNNLIDCTIIQNLYAMDNVAPRIYDLIILQLQDRKYYAQITDFIIGEPRKLSDAENIRKKLTKTSAKYNIKKTIDNNNNNIMGEYWVDYQSFYFADKEKYFNNLIEKIKILSPCSNANIPYVDIEELGLKGMRDFKHRVERYKFNEIDFKGKTVIELGCNCGEFCREMARRGAKKIIGIDRYQEMIQIEKELNNYLGYFNIDLYAENLKCDDVADKIKKITGIDKFDIILFLSMDQHVGFPKDVGNICKELFILEGGVAQKKEYFTEKMDKEFEKVYFDGITSDHCIRVIMKGENNG